MPQHAVDEAVIDRSVQVIYVCGKINHRARAQIMAQFLEDQGQLGIALHDQNRDRFVLIMFGR